MSEKEKDQNKSRRKFLKTGITAGKITVYGTTTCPWCTKQREYLDAHQIEYDFVDCGAKKGACPDFRYYSKLWVWALSPTFIRNVLMRRLDIDDH